MVSNRQLPLGAHVLTSSVDTGLFHLHLSCDSCRCCQIASGVPNFKCTNKKVWKAIIFIARVFYTRKIVHSEEEVPERSLLLVVTKVLGIIEEGVVTAISPEPGNGKRKAPSGYTLGKSKTESRVVAS